MQLHSFLLPFKELIEHKFGMAFDENRADQLLEILQTRLDELKSTPAAYMKLLNESEKEWEQLVLQFLN